MAELIVDDYCYNINPIKDIVKMSLGIIKEIKDLDVRIFSLGKKEKNGLKRLI